MYHIKDAITAGRYVKRLTATLPNSCDVNLIDRQQLYVQQDGAPSQIFQEFMGTEF